MKLPQIAASEPLLPAPVSDTAGNTVADLAPHTPLASIADDASWAAPRPRAGRRLLGLVVFLAALIVGLSSFAYGTKVGRDRAATSGGVGANGFPGFGRGGFPGGFGGAGGGATGGATGRASANPSGASAGSVADTTPADPLGGLLAGAPPEAATADTTPSSTPAASSQIVGTIESVEGDIVMVRTAEGLVAVRIAVTTHVTRSAAATAADLAPGVQVAVLNGAVLNGAVLNGAVSADATSAAETVVIQPSGGDSPLPSSVLPATSSP